MQPVSGRALMMAIQAVHAERQRLREALAEAADPEANDLEDLAEAYDKAAEELKNAYIDECRLTLNLPRFEDLLED